MTAPHTVWHQKTMALDVAGKGPAPRRFLTRCFVPSSSHRLGAAAGRPAPTGRTGGRQDLIGRPDDFRAQPVLSPTAEQRIRATHAARSGSGSRHAIHTPHALHPRPHCLGIGFGDVRVAQAVDGVDVATVESLRADELARPPLRPQLAGHVSASRVVGVQTCQGTHEVAGARPIQGCGQSVQVALPKRPLPGAAFDVPGARDGQHQACQLPSSIPNGPPPPISRSPRAGSYRTNSSQSAQVGASHASHS